MMQRSVVSLLAIVSTIYSPVILAQTGEPSESEEEEFDQEEVQGFEFFGDDDEIEYGDNITIYQEFKNRIASLSSEDQIAEWKVYLDEYPESIFLETIHDDMSRLRQSSMSKGVSDREGEITAASQVSSYEERISQIEKSIQEGDDDYELSFEGYYRMRSYSYRNLYIDQEEPGKFVSQRLRIQPQINYKDKAKFFFMTDIMDDVVWGDNQSLASTALFAEDPSFTGETGSQSASFQLKRAWMEVDLGVGSLRVGRQPSHWGLGLLANSGDGFDDAFGENHSGANFDRILFATKPIAVAQTIMGKAVTDIPLYIGYAFDRLVEDPLNQYYGFTCDNGPTGILYEGEEGYDPACDVNGDGKVDSTEVHGYTEPREEDVRELDWTFDNADDVNEHVFLTIYRGENIDFAGSKADLTAGLYGINRNQAETDSNVWIVDGYLYFLWQNLYLEGEFLNIKGESRAVPLLSDNEADPLYKDVNIWGYAAKGGYKTPEFYAIFETGFASGDNDVTDDYFTARSIHRDYNVGLLIYDEILRVTTYRGWQGSAAALRSNGGIYNSRYIFPVVRTSFLGNWEALVGYLKVWPDKPDGAIIQCSEADKDKGIECATYEATANEIGWEVDAAIKARLYNHVLFSVEGAYAQVTDRIKLDSVGLNTEGSFFTVQTRFAYEF